MNTAKNRVKNARPGSLDLSKLLYQKCPQMNITEKVHNREKPPPAAGMYCNSLDTNTR